MPNPWVRFKKEKKRKKQKEICRFVLGFSDMTLTLRNRLGGLGAITFANLWSPW